MTKVKIIPISKRARATTKEHGAIMELIGATELAVSVKSLEKTWNSDYWVGWFILGADAQYIEIKE